MTGSPSSRRNSTTAPVSTVSSASFALTKLVGQVAPRRSTVVMGLFLLSDLGGDGLGGNGGIDREGGEALPQAGEQSFGPLGANHVAEPDPALAFGLFLVPPQDRGDEVDHLVFGQELGEQGAHQGTAAPFAADPHGVALFSRPPGLGGADLEAVAAVEAVGGDEAGLAVVSHGNGVFGA